MPGCCHLTRRQLLRWSAIVAATPLVLPGEELERAVAQVRSRGTGRVVPMNLELVTLTETTAILTWYTGEAGTVDGLGRPAPMPADTEILLGTSRGSLRTVYADDRPTPYHYAEVTGLEPGETYFYVARSAGVPAAPSAFSLGNPVGTSTAATSATGPFVFTTPQPPPGRHLLTIALCNDLHMGETVAGLVTSSFGGVPPGFSQVPGEPPYPEVMAEALVADARARGATLLLAAGDVSAEAVPKDLSRAREILDGFGDLGEDYLVARGNHDRAHAGAAYATCTPVDGADGYDDCFRDAFFPDDRPTWFTHEVRGLSILGLDTYDKIGPGSDNGALSDEQWSFVEAELARNPEQPRIVFGHHPVTLEASATTAEPIVFDLDPQQAQRLQELYGKTPGVFLHHSGHTHRNKRTASPVAPGVVFQEVAATKEYPGGFHLLRIHTGGYALNFYKTRSDLAREWSERTRQEDLNGVPYYVFGNVADRNMVAAHDFSGVHGRP